MENTHVAVLNGKTIRFNAADYDDTISAFVQAHGPGVPSISKIEQTLAEPIKPTEPAQPAQSRQIGTMDQAGLERAERDQKIAEDSGFSPEPPLFQLGEAATGMDRHRAEFDALPIAREAVRELASVVKSEERRDITVPCHAIRMANDGQLATKLWRTPVTERCLPQFAKAIGMPGSPGSYLASVWPELRAINVNRWTARLAEKNDQAASVDPKHEPSTVVLRTRNAARGGREVFGAVSERFGAYDTDAICEAIGAAIPSDARADLTYDGYRMRFDGLWFTDTPVGTEVAGEIFKAGVRVRTTDTGGQSIIVEAVIWRNLCLNFIIIGQSAQPVARIRHIGSPEKMARHFRKAFTDSLKLVAGFRQVWGYAMNENVAERTSQIEVANGREPLEAIPVSKLLPGLFNGLLERELVPLPKRNRAETVGNLVRMYERDEYRPTEPTRASIVNAVTRYAHEVNDDPFVAADIEKAAGRLLYGKRANVSPAPLPYQAI